jgi:hypothetical protein
MTTTLHGLFLDKFDYTTGEIPVWLAGDLHQRWIEVVAEGRKPDIVLNASGYYVRAVRGPDGAPGNGSSEPHEDAETEAPGADAGSERASKAPGSEPRFKVTRYCDLRTGVGQEDSLVDELFPIEGLALLWGRFKSLKSFLMYDLCLHVAQGWEYRGRAVRQGLVIYCAFEGAHGFRRRTDAQRIHYEIPEDLDVPLRVMGCQMNLAKDHKKFISDIRVQLAGGEVPAMVVLDTLNRSLVGSEGKDIDMSAYIAAAGAIREAFKCLVVIVHHCGWDESRPRGHSSLTGAIDAQLSVTRDGDHVTVTVEFLKEGPEGVEIHSTIKKYVVGTDTNGKEITSLVVIPSDATARKVWPPGLVTFRRAVKAALEKYAELYQETVLDLPIRVAAIEDVRKEFYAIYVPAGEEQNAEQRQEAKRKQFVRSLKRAIEDGLINCREPEGKPPFLWLAHEGAADTQDFQ